MNDTKLKENLFTEWEKSPPYDQCRLSLLEQIDFNDWDKLLDLNEQEEFGLENDEFLIYTDRYQGVIADNFMIFLYTSSIISVPLLMYDRFFKYSENYKETFIGSNINFVMFFSIICIIFCCFYMLIKRYKKYFFITNKNLYINKRKKISINGLSVKIRSSLYSIRKINNEKTARYRLDIDYFFINNIFLEKMSLYKNISLSHRNDKNELYILNIISFISEKKCYISYIYPIQCAAKNRQNSVIVKFIKLFAPLLGPGVFITHPHIFDDQEEDIDIRFSSREKLISFIEKTAFKKHKCKNTMLALAMQGRDVPDEELFTVEAKGKIFCKKYILSVHKNYIELVYKNELLRLGIEEYKKSIFNSNKSFIIIFPYQNKQIFIYAKKKDMDIPFLEIMEALSGASIPFHRPLIAEMWYS